MCGIRDRRVEIGASERSARSSSRAASHAREEHRALLAGSIARRSSLSLPPFAASHSALRNSLAEFGRQDSPNLFAAGVRAGNRGETERASPGHTRGCPVLLPVTLKHVRPRQRPWLDAPLGVVYPNSPADPIQPSPAFAPYAREDAHAWCSESVARLAGTGGSIV
jgi:hypothetical protein